MLIRPKKAGVGLHYGTVVRTETVVPANALVGIYPKFLVAHTMPDTGKRPDTIDGSLTGCRVGECAPTGTRWSASSSNSGLFLISAGGTPR